MIGASRSGLSVINSACEKLYTNDELKQVPVDLVVIAPTTGPIRSLDEATPKCKEITPNANNVCYIDANEKLNSLYSPVHHNEFDFSNVQQNVVIYQSEDPEKKHKNQIGDKRNNNKTDNGLNETDKEITVAEKNYKVIKTFLENRPENDGKGSKNSSSSTGNRHSQV
ncbi:MAG: hypothetical protein GY821_01310 [Gammaproteobacteria bacterium]|nr:hypothetical protein [Gammaproteobacteria bacterium]